MQFLILLIGALNSSYFVEWIPNNATAPEPSTDASAGEWPWQGGW